MSNVGRHEKQPVVYIIDDDPEFCSSAGTLLRTVGLRVEEFYTTQEFKATDFEDVPSCLLLDVRLRGESGLAFQRQVERGPAIPIIFVTGFADVEVCRQALRGGAFDFLVKPFGDQELIETVNACLELDAKRRCVDRARNEHVRAYETLTDREKEVMSYVVGGALNKQIAEWLGVSVMTVKLHRASVMRKAGASSLVDLVRKAEIIGLETSPIRDK
jgi:FixJ family two-component response regulator